MNRKFKVILIAVLALFLMSSCKVKNSNEDTGPHFTGSVTLGAYSDSTLNPLVTKLYTNAMTYSVIYSPLVRLNEDLSAEYILLEDFKMENGGSTAILTVKDAVFSDSSKVTASNVITSLNLIRDNPDSIYYGIFDYIDTYREISDRSLQVGLKSPSAAFISMLTFPVVKDENSNIGSGPFVVSSKNSEKIVLEANPLSPTIPKLKSVTVKIYPAKDTLPDAFANNEIDTINADITNLARFSLMDKVKHNEYISDDYTFLGFNCGKAMFTDMNFKKAISCLIDKDLLTSSTLVGHAVKASTPFKPNSIYHSDYDYSFNKDKAAKYLKSSDLEISDVNFVILVNKDNLSAKNTAEFIANSINDAGGKISLDLQPYEDYTNKLASGNFDSFIGEITMPVNNDIGFLFQAENMFFFNNKYINNALYTFNNSPYGNEKIKASVNVNKAYLNTLPSISLYYKTNELLFNKSFENTLNITATDIYKNIYKWEEK